MRAALLLVVLVGCDSGRDYDCERVRATLTAPRPGRYDEAAQRWEEPYMRLRKMTFRDSEVAAAVKAMVDETGWTFYTPYSTERPASSGSERLAKLCHL
jgi:hypothetical protein